ncbi:MAG TPA: hypothetical protein VF407_11685, partial [Polyangiaceae bacterium]
VAPGEIARFTFDVTSDANVSARLDDNFALQIAGGNDIACPSPLLATSIWVGPNADLNAANDGTGPVDGGTGDVDGDAVSSSSGCSTSASSSSAEGGFAFVMFGLVLGARARRRSRKASKGVSS